jgi:hypothetical protein
MPLLVDHLVEERRNVVRSTNDVGRGETETTANPMQGGRIS